MGRLCCLRSAATAYALLVSVAVCGCGSDDNPLASARKMVKDHPGANTPISAATVDSATAAVGQVMTTSFARTFASALASIFGGKPARGSQGGSLTITLEEEVFAGINSGSVTVRGGKIVLTSNSMTGETAMEMSSSLQYDDFSDDGIVFVGGTVEFKMNAVIASGTEEIESLSGTYKAYIAITGKYKGAMAMDLTLTQGADGLATISGTVDVDGQSMNVQLTGVKIFGDDESP